MLSSSESARMAASTSEERWAAVEGQPETGGVGEQRMVEGARVEAFEAGGTSGRAGFQPGGDDAVYRFL